MIRILIFAAAILLSAYDTTSEKCDADFDKWCKDSEETKSNCLQQNFENVTNPDCKQELSGARDDWQKKSQSFEQVKGACQEDLKKFCPEDENSIKNYQVCMMMNGDKLTEKCKSEMNRHIKTHLPGINSMK